ncbi:hypothetical protein F8S13_09315 [Chloroflexia bacterium SDU3-3]|nr:hypothetical protein F8S13_09315 [Chloroflexia bacterium SDU3-3]
MPNSQKISGEALRFDQELIVRLQELADYRPANSAFSIEALIAANDAVLIAAQAEIRAEHALQVARSASQQARLHLHQLVLGAKTQVVAQYGSDSPVLATVGLKRRSEYKTPVRRSLAADPNE